MRPLSPINAALDLLIARGYKIYGRVAAPGVIRYALISPDERIEMSEAELVAEAARLTSAPQQGQIWQ